MTSGWLLGLSVQPLTDWLHGRLPRALCVFVSRATVRLDIVSYKPLQETGFSSFPDATRTPCSLAISLAAGLRHARLRPVLALRTQSGPPHDPNPAGRPTASVGYRPKVGVPEGVPNILFVSSHHAIVALSSLCSRSRPPRCAPPHQPDGPAAAR